MKYEYLSVTFSGGIESLQQWLNERGQQGWKVIAPVLGQHLDNGLVTVHFIFMRELPPEFDVTMRGVPPHHFIERPVPPPPPPPGMPSGPLKVK